MGFWSTGTWLIAILTRTAPIEFLSFIDARMMALPLQHMPSLRISVWTVNLWFRTQYHSVYSLLNCPPLPDCVLDDFYLWTLSVLCLFADGTKTRRAHSLITLSSYISMGRKDHRPGVDIMRYLHHRFNSVGVRGKRCIGDWIIEGPDAPCLFLVRIP